MINFKEYINGYYNILDKNLLKNILLSLSIKRKEDIIYPDNMSLFEAFYYCKYKDLKVVILGQDPYPNKNATGIAFGNNINTIELSPSLNILKEAMLGVNINKNISFDITLQSIAKQGILFLNTALSVINNKPGSHLLLWRPFIIDFLNKLSLYDTGIIYLLLGNTAQTYEKYINKKFNIIMKEKHPSYYAITKQKMPEKVFRDIENIIFNYYNEKIKFYGEIF